jgi:hypothetical protein
VLASVEEVAYKALLPPHSLGEPRVRGYMCWVFLGLFGGFASLRFIWCLCAIHTEVTVNGKPQDSRKSNKGFTMLIFQG